MATEPAERKKIYRKRKKSGYCPRCETKIKKSSPYIFCDDCREYFRNYNNEVSEDQNEIRRSRYAERKANNCCPRCGVFLGKKYSKSLCSSCLNKQYKYNTGTTRKKKPAKK